MNQIRPEDKHVVLCTGGCGYIFGSLLNYLVIKYPNWKFINFDALYSASLPENITVGTQPNYSFVKGRVQDYDLVTEILKTHKPTIVIHAAAKSNVDESYMEPLSYLEDNVLGTGTFVKAVHDSGLCPLFMHISTDEVYSHSVGETPNSELSLLRPSNPYSSSKAAAEMCVMAYMHSYGLKLIIVRPNNVYGVRHRYKMIPKFIDMLREGHKLTIHGEGNAQRSFLYISDMIQALELIMLKGKIGEIYNIASHSEISVLEMSKLLIRKIKGTTETEKYIEFVKDRPFNDQRYFISDSKLRSLGFRQQVELEEGIDLILKDLEPG